MTSFEFENKGCRGAANLLRHRSRPHLAAAMRDRASRINDIRNGTAHKLGQQQMTRDALSLAAKPAAVSAQSLSGVRDP